LLNESRIGIKNYKALNKQYSSHLRIDSIALDISNVPSFNLDFIESSINMDTQNSNHQNKEMNAPAVP
jgi:hypothetical protein